MKKKLLRILRIVIVIFLIFLVGFILYGKRNESRYLNSGNSFLLKNEGSIDHDNNEATYSIVQVTYETHTGSAVIFKKMAEEMILVTSGHILQYGDEVTVQFSSGNTYKAAVIGLSNDFDLGFCRINSNDLADCDKVQAAVQCCEITPEKLLKESAPVSHIGVDTRRQDDEPFYVVFDSVISNYYFVPEFYEMMLISKGFSKKGMSGGGAFTKDGQFIGLISGGEEISDEEFITYVIPVEDILASYNSEIKTIY